MAETTFIGSALLVRVMEEQVRLWEQWFLDDGGTPCICEVIVDDWAAPHILIMPRAWFVAHARKYLTRTQAPTVLGLHYGYHSPDAAAWHWRVVTAWALAGEPDDDPR